VNILLITPYLPHYRSGHGGGLLVYELIQLLHGTCEITIVTFLTREEEPLLLDLRRQGIRVVAVPRQRGAPSSPIALVHFVRMRFNALVKGIIAGVPYSVAKYADATMMDALKSLMESQQFDILQVEYSHMSAYLLPFHNVCRIVRAHDVVIRPAYRRYHRARNPLSRLFRFLSFCSWSRYERRLPLGVDHVITLTEQDAALLRRISQRTNISSIPPGIQIPREIPEYTTRSPGTILFVGSLDLDSNADAAEWLCSDIFPLVQKAFPAVTLLIAGRNPSRRLRTIQEQNAGIRLLGFVQNLEDLLKTSRVFVAPIRTGGGVKTKILQAGAFGLPIVTTARGREGIEGLDTFSISCGADASTLATHIVRFLREPENAAAVGARCREIMIREYSRESSKEKLLRLYMTLKRSNQPIDA
jgi:glycosyltransferase involved in cell wall biosynthesis